MLAKVLDMHCALNEQSLFVVVVIWVVTAMVIIVTATKVFYLFIDEKTRLRESHRIPSPFLDKT